jgi:hypothetical protein
VEIQLKQIQRVNTRLVFNLKLIALLYFIALFVLIPLIKENLIVYLIPELILAVIIPFIPTYLEIGLFAFNEEGISSPERIAWSDIAQLRIKTKTPHSSESYVFGLLTLTAYGLGSFISIETTDGTSHTFNFFLNDWDERDLIWDNLIEHQHKYGFKVQR